MTFLKGKKIKGKKERRKLKASENERNKLRRKQLPSRKKLVRVQGGVFPLKPGSSATDFEAKDDPIAAKRYRGRSRI